MSRLPQNQNKIGAPNMHLEKAGNPVEDSMALSQLPHVNWKEFACGWGAAFINIAITYPINKMIFRQMLHGVKTQSAFHQLHEEGLYFLYRGMFPPLCQKTLSMSIMFGVYDETSRPMLKLGVNPYVAKATGAVVAGTLEAIFMPFERIQTLLSDAHYHKCFRNTVDAFKKVGYEYGFREYYRGLTPVLLRNGPSNIGFFIVREEMQNKLPHFDSRIYQSITEFVYGALIGAGLSTLFYPLNVVKIAMQSKLGGDYEGVWQVLVQIYHERGSKVTNIYHGLTLNCTRAFISWGVINCAYEYLKHGL